jgi:hypothetical protein
MAKQSAAIECSNCASVCTIYGSNADTVQFCPFCGDGVLLSYDNVGLADDENLLDQDMEYED